MGNDAVTINSVLSGALGRQPVTALTDQLAQLTTQLQQLQTVTQGAVESGVVTPTRVASNSTSQSPNGGSGGDIGSTLLSVFTSGLGLSPLISGLTSLFTGGGDSNALPPLVRFALPSALNANAGVSEADPGAAFGVSQSQGGASRPNTGSAPTQITVQVQAMDSQSFLDRSSDIAAAVRQAMLQSSVLNDVIRGA
jgi:hypothetical protein